MKKLHSINFSHLSALEFGQYTKSILENIQLLGSKLISDSVLKNYIENLTSKIGDYDKAVMQVTKSDETAKIVAADKLRDNALSTAIRQLAVFEYSQDEAESSAYESLKTLFNHYKNIQSWNFEEETNGIDNLLTDLGNTKYLPHVTLLGMPSFLAKILASNTAFKTLFTNRTQEASAKTVYDLKTMRASIKPILQDMDNYILSMAKAQNTDQYNKPLNVINTIRKYYDDLLAKRKPATKTNPEVAISPMPKL